MKINKLIHLPLILFAAFLLLGIFSEMYVLNSGIKQQDIKQFSKTLHRKQHILDDILQDVAEKLDEQETNELPNEIFSTLKSYNGLFGNKELAILINEGNNLIYWSDNVVGFNHEIINANEGYIQLPNGWFVHTSETVGKYTIHGLILIKYDYKINNEYLNNTFAHGFHLPNDFEVHFYENENSYPIYDYQNRFLFSIEPSGVLPCIYSDLYIPVAFYLLTLLFLFLSIFRINKHHFHRYKITKLIVLVLFLFGVYFFLNKTELPRSVFLLNLFSPVSFAYSSFWKSLGEFLLFSFFILFAGISYFQFFDISKSIKRHVVKRRVCLFTCLIIIGLFFIFIRFMIYVLIMNSSISFTIYRIEEITFNSAIGFLAITFLFISLFFVVLKTARIFRKNSSIGEFLIILSVCTIILIVSTYLFAPASNFRLSIFYWIIALTLFLISKKNLLNHHMSVIVLFVFIFTLYALFTFVKFLEEHENNIQKVTALNLSAEHDPTAELYLIDIDNQLKNDSILQNYLVPPYDYVESYLSQTYFGGYLRDYDFQVTICGSHDSVTIQPDNITTSCFPFFEELLRENGAVIPETNFYFLDNMNGRISYFGKYDFQIGNNKFSLFIELNSKLLSEGTGFPELLLPQHSIENRIHNNFSFAKYSNEQLVDRGGDYLYALTSKAYNLPEDELSFDTWDNCEHCIYRINDKSIIIVSRPCIYIYDYFVAFPYVFVFLFIVSVIINFLGKPHFWSLKVSNSLRMRIQLSIIGVVFFALLIVGGGIILYNITQYKRQHKDDLIEKINSLSIEIDGLLMGKVDEFTPEIVDYLSYDLIRISDIFKTDINIYDLNGNLVVTSRPEVFDKGLISEQIDNAAIYYLNTFQPTRFLHKEHIAKMEYLSAYVPLINYSGKNIGYINVPYFTKERQFRKEITTFIVAFINIYVFLLLAGILVAYFISARITEPLKLIRENLRIMQLGKNTQPIKYDSDDEIGALVLEYNIKVQELEESAELIARSEREFAWREMAKQIAHEIKNPLTPMKLNIQFLQHSNPSSPDYEDKLKRVSETIIEQIDNLSNIASAFSNFAKIPKANNEEFYLVERLQEILKLYNYTGQVQIIYEFTGFEYIKVFADKEQFARAFINLIRNAIQAIPDNREGKITISLTVEKNVVIVIIKDNGKGIPENLRDSIFVPNFTTKSSGTGLGLAITKNIVNNFNGDIWFESQVDIGTTFYIRIPII